MEVLVVFAHVEVDAPVAHVGEARVEDFLHQLDLLDDVARGMGLDAGGQHPEGFHGQVVAVGVVLCHLHGLQLLQTGFLGNLVLAFVGIVFQMAHVGDIAHIAHFIPYVAQVAEEDVEGDGGAGMTQMGVAVHRGAAHIHAHISGRQRLEKFFLVRQCVVYQQWLHSLVVCLVLLIFS